jgi:hypothetical protein
MTSMAGNCLIIWHYHKFATTLVRQKVKHDYYIECGGVIFTVIAQPPSGD